MRFARLDNFWSNQLFFLRFMRLADFWNDWLFVFLEIYKIGRILKLRTFCFLWDLLDWANFWKKLLFVFLEIYELLMKLSYYIHLGKKVFGLSWVSNPSTPKRDPSTLHPGSERCFVIFARLFLTDTLFEDLLNWSNFFGRSLSWLSAHKRPLA